MAVIAALEGEETRGDLHVIVHQTHKASKSRRLKASKAL
jgi:hypothetical protein